MKIQYQKIVKYEVEVTPEEFVKEHLIEIHKHKNKDEYEYDFYVADRINKGILSRVFTLPSKLFHIDLRNFKTDGWTKQDNNMLIQVLESLPNWHDL